MGCFSWFTQDKSHKSVTSCTYVSEYKDPDIIK